MEKRRLIKPAIIYGVVWLACLVLYWGFLATGDLGWRHRAPTLAAAQTLTFARAVGAAN